MARDSRFAADRDASAAADRGAACSDVLPQCDSRTGGPDCIGQLEDGSWISADRDRVGIGTLYLPNRRAPQAIVWDWWYQEAYLPGCGPEGSLLVYNACTLDRYGRPYTLHGNITYALRLAIQPSSGLGRIDFAPGTARNYSMTSYTYWIADTPGGGPMAGGLGCQLGPQTPRYYARVGSTPLSSWERGFFESACKLEANTLYYVSFRSDNASCGTGDVVCQQYGQWYDWETDRSLEAAPISACERPADP